MICPAPYLLLYLNFVFLMILSKYFFKKGGTWTLERILALFPFLVAPYYLLCVLLGFAVPFFGTQTPVAELLQAFSVFFSVGAFILTAYTVGCHRQPVSLCHQPNDSPDHLVNYGSYRLVRHPLYTAHLLVLAGVFVLAPHWISLLLFVYGFIIFNMTARQEEALFLKSKFAAEYSDYMKTTGRFLPRWF